MLFDKSVIVPLDPDATFELVTQPERLRRWMAVAARVELRPGGDYRWTVAPGHIAAGTVVEVEPGKRVVYTWGWEDGDPAPGGSTVTLHGQTGGRGPGRRRGTRRMGGGTRPARRIVLRRSDIGGAAGRAA